MKVRETQYSYKRCILQQQQLIHFFLTFYALNFLEALQTFSASKGAVEKMFQAIIHNFNVSSLAVFDLVRCCYFSMYFSLNYTIEKWKLCAFVPKCNVIAFR